MKLFLATLLLVSTASATSLETPKTVGGTTTVEWGGVPPEQAVSHAVGSDTTLAKPSQKSVKPQKPRHWNLNNSGTVTESTQPVNGTTTVKQGK